MSSPPLPVRPPRPGRTAPAAALLLAAQLLLVACGGGEEPAASARDLLRLGPDGVLEDPGAILPDRAEQWGARGRFGWEARTRERDGLAHVLAAGAAARLELAASGPEERTLELELWHPALPADLPPAERRAEVRLNDRLLGALELSGEPRTHRLTVPAEAWRSGPNELVLRIHPRLVWRTEGGEERGLALAAVRTGPARRATRDADGAWTLAPGSGLEWVVEADGGALALEAETAGSGTLAVEIERLQPRTGRVLARERQELAAAELGRIALPLQAGAPARLRLRWDGGPEAAPLRLAALELMERRQRPLSVVLVSIDTLSASHTSLHGYARATTPRLDAFAREAAVFESCASNAPWTTPSYIALFTGLLPAAVPMDFEREGRRFPVALPDEGLSLAEALRARGYRTAGFVDALHIGARAGFAQGFERFDESAGRIDLVDPDGGMRHVTPLALDWLDGLAPDEPFFLFVHAYDVHGPFLPDEPWKGAFSRPAAQDEALFHAPTHVAAYGSIPSYIAEPAWPEGDVPPRVPVTPFVDAYDEEILALDAALGELLDGLGARGLLERSVVIVTADHGELTGEHDFFGHGLLYEEVLHVPLVLRLPREHPHAGGRRIPDRVQLIDLYPTLVELTGAPYGADEVHGRSLVPLLRGERQAPRPTLSEGGIMRQSSIVHGGWKLIESDPRFDAKPATMLTHPGLDRAWLEQHAPFLIDAPVTTEALLRLRSGFHSDLAFVESIQRALPGPVHELYDLRADPAELEDLAARRPEKLQELLQVLAHAREQRAGSAGGDLVHGGGDGGAGSAPELSEEELRDLEKLGYVDR